jgi:hypothetical protein
VTISHDVSWIPDTGSYEDGYLLGLKAVIRLFERLLADLAV